MQSWNKIAVCCCTALLAGTLACAAPKPVPELPTKLPETSPPGFEESVEARIEASLPEVSYSASPGRFPDLSWEASVDGQPAPDRDQVEVWIRQLESLDGDRPVVCRTDPDSVFGDCTFPVSNAPAETPASSRPKTAGN